MEDLESKRQADSAGTPLFVEEAFYRRASFPAKIAVMAAGVTLPVLAMLLLPWLAGPATHAVNETTEMKVVAQAPQFLAVIGFTGVAAMIFFYMLFSIYAKRAYRPYQQAYKAMVRGGMSSLEARIEISKLWRSRSFTAK